MIHDITRFEGEYRFLSNFPDAPVELDGIWYRSPEYAYQAAKTVKPDLRIPFHSNPKLTPGMAKRLGSKLEIRPDWDDPYFYKLIVMEDLLNQKYMIPEFGQKLILTAPAKLVEGNWWHDNFWGECVCSKCKDKTKHNHLGILTMKVRDKLIKTIAYEAATTRS